MAFTDAQLQKLAEGRKANPPSFFNSETGENAIISQATEDALILLPSSVKQQAAQYLDILLNTNPSKSDYDIITARAATKQADNLAAAMSELESVIDNFSEFKDDLTGSGSSESIYSDGTAPLLQAMLRGFGSIKNSYESAKFLRKMAQATETKYTNKLTDSMRKEWRSWKRVILSYPS